MDMAPLVELVGVQPVRAYDKGSLDQFVIAAQHERTRLHEALRAASERRTVAEQRVAEVANVRLRLATMVEETQRLVAQLKRENERAVAAILAAAEAEADALVSAARVEVPFQEQPRVELTVVPAG